MERITPAIWNALGTIADVLWHDYVLYTVLGVGVLFTIWSGFSQYRSLTHGFAVIRGKYDSKNHPGAINHFQALSAALSATVGLGNIAGVALAVALGGPGAVFWMWVVGVFGMAIKLTEVTQSMLYRNTDDPDNPHGGPMWVVEKGFAQWGLRPLGAAIAGIFVVTLLISTITGGNMFQAWAVADVTRTYFDAPPIATGIILAIIVGAVIIGGIKRIGAVAGRLVPLMCALYLLAAVYVVMMNIGAVPGLLVLIVTEAFSPTEAAGAFLGGTAGYALLWGMKRALFSSEAGQGSSPIAHSAAKTDEPVREGVVAGLEPFIDTLVVCTLTALVILSTGTWNREAEAVYSGELRLVAVDSASANTDRYIIETDEALPRKTAEGRRVGGPWRAGQDVFTVIEAHENRSTGLRLHRVYGTVQGTGEVTPDEREIFRVAWRPVDVPAGTVPRIQTQGVWIDYKGASLTGFAFDTVQPGLGKWLVVVACWLFAISTMISWSYYGEQGVYYFVRNASPATKGQVVLIYKLVYCLIIALTTLGFIRTDDELDLFTGLGTGVMLWANIPIMLIFGATAMRAYHGYIRRLKSGELDRAAHANPKFSDVVSNKDVE